MLRIVVAFLGVGVTFSVNAQNYSNCGSLENAYGPYDYTNPLHVRDKLPIVENAHFTTEVESLRGHNKCGGNGCQLSPDIAYTLRAFPNHHRALMTMVRYHLEGRDKSKPMMFTPACFFERAIRFQPSDGTVRMIYGYYLSKTGKSKEALEEYAKAVEIMPNSAEAHYNIALMYTDMEDYPRAVKHAHRAYGLGFPLPGLRRRLEREGRWVDPAPVKPSDNH